MFYCTWPGCKGKTGVSDTRSTPGGLLRRRRVCKKNKTHVFTTLEMALDNRFQKSKDAYATFKNIAAAEQLQDIVDYMKGKK